MAAVKLLLSQARRHCLYRSTTLLRPSSSAPFSKPFSSSSPESPPPPPNDTPTEPRRREPISIRPVSYAVKPKEEQPPSPESGAPEDGQRLPPQQRPPGPSDFQARTSWTREDARYVKDGPEIAPVSYPARVAPLPEDKPFEEERNESTPDEGRESGMQRRRIERDGGMIMMRRRRGGRMYEDVEEENEKEKLPFPAPIKVVKNERKPIFDLNEALRLVKENAKSNFDETVEAHVRLGIDRKRSDLIVRGSMLLPHGEGMKVSKIAFLGEGVEAEEARAAGADIVGGLELVEKIANSGGKFAVQKCFTTPAFMPNVLKIAKVLKPLGLLPNAKQGTLVSNVTQAVKDAKQSNVDFRMDKSSIVHVGLGKVSLSEAYLRENIGAFVNALLRAKPAGLKKASKFAGYVDAFHICSTMGPGFAVSIQSLSKAADNYSKANL